MLSSPLPWLLAYREQQQLFLHDWHYVAGLVSCAGGVSSLLARFAVQYFGNPTLALAIVLILAAVIAVLMWLPFRKKPSLLPVCAIPFMAVLAMSGVLALHFDAVVAYGFAALAFAIYPFVRCGSLVKGIVATLVLYVIAGPACLLFALSAAIFEAFGTRTWKCVYQLIDVALAVVLCLLSYFAGQVASFGAAVGPAFFFEPTIDLPHHIYLAWFSMPIAVLALCFADRFFKRWPEALALSGVCAVAAIVLTLNLSGLTKTTPEDEICKYEYFCRNGQWDKLEQAARGNMNRYVDANYYNLAMAEQGRLAEELFDATQHTPNSLIFLPQDNTSNPIVARVLFAMGDVAAAQSVAFNSMRSFCGFNPEMVRIVTLVDLMRGSYKPAEKYLDMLAKSRNDKDWAAEYSAFLYTDAAVEQDSLLACGRRNFDCRDGFVLDPGPMDDIFRVLDANPSDACAMQYGLSYLLLAKDIVNVQKFVDHYYGSPALQTLPKPAQEALLFYVDYCNNVVGDSSIDREYCASHGVEQATFDRFDKFQQATMDNGGKAPNSYKNSFWYYMIYEQI